MIRKEIIKEIGKLKPSISTYNTDDINFSSVFIIPVPHKVHEIRDIKNLFNNIQKNWTIKNNTIEKDLATYDIKEYIKDNTFAKINLKEDSKKYEKDLKNFIYDKKNLYLSHNTKNLLLKYEDIEFILTEIDLWIMDGNIAFFTYKVKLNKDKLIDINTISTKLNRDLRDYKNLCINIDEKKIYTKEKDSGDLNVPLLSYLISLTFNDIKNSFLNIKFDEINGFNVDSGLSTIVTSTYYAKMMTALHIDDSLVTVDGTKEEISPILDRLSETATLDLGILEELSYLLGATSSYDFEKELGFVGYEGYTYAIIQEKGINIWKLWSGIALQDSVAFVSMNQGGAGIVYAAKTSNYFIYIINMYINIRLKYLENYLIDKDFINIERVLPSVREIQILKNHYIASEIARKFQPNYINEKICLGLGNIDLLDEVENNLQTTLELTRSNTDIVFSLGAAVATLASMWLTNDLIIELYDKHPYMTISSVIFLSILIVVAISKKSLIVRFVKRAFKFVKRIIGI